MNRSSLAALMLTFVSSGCSHALFNEENNGQRVDLDLDRAFTIALPAKDRSQPEVNGSSVRYVGAEMGQDGRDLYVFRTRDPGDTEILFFKSNLPFHVPEFAMRVHVVAPEYSHRLGVVFIPTCRYPAVCRHR